MQLQTNRQLRILPQMYLLLRRFRIQITTDTAEVEKYQALEIIHIKAKFS